MKEEGKKGPVKWRDLKTSEEAWKKGKQFTFSAYHETCIVPLSVSLPPLLQVRKPDCPSVTMRVNGGTRV